MVALKFMPIIFVNGKNVILQENACSKGNQVNVKCNLLTQYTHLKNTKWTT